MKSAWEKALDFTLSYEGGYANNPADRGGETFRGIARNFHPSWEGWPIIDKMKTWPEFPAVAEHDASLEEMAKAFYKDQFWNAIHGDELPEKMAVAMFDCAVNSGVGRAVRLLQTALGVTVDGVLGPKTVKAAHDAGERGVIDLLARRAKFIHEIMDNDPSQKVWAMNWFRRLFKLANVVLDDREAA